MQDADEKVAAEAQALEEDVDALFTGDWDMMIALLPSVRDEAVRSAMLELCTRHVAGAPWVFDRGTWDPWKPCYPTTSFASYIHLTLLSLLMFLCRAGRGCS